MEINLDGLKSIQLKILEDTISICNLLNIDYFLIAGSLIGVVRHEGFIPWDDDIDIAMTRKDYMIFKRYISESKSDQYFLQDYESEKLYYNPFSKLRLNGSIYEEKTVKHLNIHKGIFVDIFLLDYSKKGKGILLDLRGKLIKNIGSFISYKTLYLDEQQYTLKQKLISRFGKFLPNGCLKKVQVWLMSLGKDYSKYLINFGCQYGYKKQTFEYDDYFPHRVAVFEGINVSIPHNFDKILTQVYGDYMKIPDKENQITHSPEYISINMKEN